jgi:uncharacterized iron-regulated protein
MKGNTASWLLDGLDDFQTSRLPSGQKLWKHIKEDYKIKQFMTACLVLESNKLHTSLTIEALHTKLQPHLDEWVDTRKWTIEAYHIQHRNSWAGMEQLKNAYFIIFLLMALTVLSNSEQLFRML